MQHSIRLSELPKRTSSQLLKLCVTCHNDFQSTYWWENIECGKIRSFSFWIHLRISKCATSLWAKEIIFCKSPINSNFWSFGASGELWSLDFVHRHSCAHMRPHTRTHTRTRTHAHTHTHVQYVLVWWHHATLHSPPPNCKKNILWTPEHLCHDCDYQWQYSEGFWSARTLEQFRLNGAKRS